LRRVFRVVATPVAVNEDEDDGDAVHGGGPHLETAPPRPVCVGCRRRAPNTQTTHTLIGSKHAWRVLRQPERKGAEALEWRCPRCWAAYKAPRAG
jgi:hypothetical protein